MFLALYQAVAEEAGGAVANSNTETTASKKSTYSKNKPPLWHQCLNVVNLKWRKVQIKETCHIGIDLTGSGLSYDPVML
jgi:hypothetical protein